MQLDAQSYLERLINVATPSLGESSPADRIRLPRELDLLLSRRDGFFAFEGALNIFPFVTDSQSYSLSTWNKYDVWKNAYNHLAPEGICFAQDAFGCQFIISDNIKVFEPETGALTDFSSSLQEWADTILNNYNEHTGYSIAHDWQRENGPISPKCRLVPIIPFVLGGKYVPDNLIQMDAIKSMRLRGGLATQIEHLPDGAEIDYRVA